MMMRASLPKAGRCIAVHAAGPATPGVLSPRQRKLAAKKRKQHTDDSSKAVTPAGGPKPATKLPQQQQQQLRLNDVTSEVTLSRDVIYLSDDAGGSRAVPEARLTGWQSDIGATFKYSGKEMQPQAGGMSQTCAQVREVLREVTGEAFDSLLINYYPDGKAGMRFHVDPLYGCWTPTAAVVSLGDKRQFVFRRIDDFSVRWNYRVSNGDVVVMFGDCQEQLQHAIKVEAAAGDAGPRVSLVYKQRLKQQDGSWALRFCYRSTVRGIMKLQLTVTLLLVGAAAVLAGTASVDKVDAAQFGGRNGVRGNMPGGGSWLDAPGRMWQGRKMLGIQCGWRCNMPHSTGRTWQNSGPGRIWQRSGGSSFRYLLSVTEQKAAPIPATSSKKEASQQQQNKESAQQWRSSMPSSAGRGWQGGSTGRIWQG
ncbi:hypothetical protein OEZ85_000237 [Tetradesmus obliquus]|uniref:Fe2OG dioxygenase domain-containing protein n=1 Tax=Tetradesmus obliquus TaxID=3088 RepID=A0ABY8UT33_TETOB|nr:hypothetical protein OEZ85_000237 [Tetradesmus obliquus]